LGRAAVRDWLTTRKPPLPALAVSVARASVPGGPERCLENTLNLQRRTPQWRPFVSLQAERRKSCVGARVLNTVRMLKRRRRPGFPLMTSSPESCRRHHVHGKLFVRRNSIPHYRGACAYRNMSLSTMPQSARLTVCDKLADRSERICPHKWRWPTDGISILAGEKARLLQAMRFAHLQFTCLIARQAAH